MDFLKFILLGLCFDFQKQFCESLFHYFCKTWSLYVFKYWLFLIFSETLIRYSEQSYKNLNLHMRTDFQLAPFLWKPDKGKMSTLLLGYIAYDTNDPLIGKLCLDWGEL